MIIEEFNELLRLLIKSHGSDLHIPAGEQIRIRIEGKLKPVQGPIYNREELVDLLKVILRSRWEEMVKKKNIDFSYKLDNNNFRGNAFFQKNGPSINIRVIPEKIPSLDELNFPPIVKKLALLERGLVLVTGITGSGKSTTLAAMINEINKNKSKHIITLEDPIEFVHKSNKSLINQRSLGEDVLSFSYGLRAALREDPDIIMVGEMRDKETMEIALHAAETGHLVFSTLHTLDTKETINRIIGTFPTEEQNRIRMILANVLEGIIGQRLIPTVDKKRTAAMEIMIKTPRIKEMILQNRDQEIKDALEEGHKVYNTQTFDQHLMELVLSGKVAEAEALKYASNESDFHLKLKRELAKKQGGITYTNLELKEK